MALGLSSCRCQNIEFHFQKLYIPWLRWHQWGLLQKEEGDVVRHDGQHVDDVHPVPEELTLTRRPDQPRVLSANQREDGLAVGQ